MFEKVQTSFFLFYSTTILKLSIMEQQYRKERKNKITLDIHLNEEQKEAKGDLLIHDVSIVTGKAGTGKSLLCAHTAMDLFLNHGYTKIIIARPYVIDEDWGHVPGDVKEKFAGIMAAIYENFQRVYGKTADKKKKLEKYFDDGDIQLVPIGYMKGRTFMDSVILIEESEDVTPPQMKLILTRLGKGSKILINGDLAQTSVKGRSGLENLFRAEPNIERMCHVSLETNHRASIVKDILKYFEE